jgi:hypothetical protein
MRFCGEKERSGIGEGMPTQSMGVPDIMKANLAESIGA